MDGSSDPIGVELVYDPRTEPVKLSDQLVSSGMAQRQSTKAAVASSLADAAPVRGAQIHSGVLPKGIFKGIISDSTGPGDFYIQVMTQENAINLGTLTQNLNSTYGNAGPSHFRPTVGGACAAPDKASGEWNRAVAEDYASQDTVVVRFVDYGNAEEVTLANVHKLEDRFIEGMPTLAVNCALAGVTPTGCEWSKDAMTIMKKVSHYLYFYHY